MAEKVLRNESTEVGKRIWKAVDAAASRAPEWIKARDAASPSHARSRDLKEPEKKGSK